VTVDEVWVGTWIYLKLSIIHTLNKLLQLAIDSTGCCLATAPRLPSLLAGVFFTTNYHIQVSVFSHVAFNGGSSPSSGPTPSQAGEHLTPTSSSHCRLTGLVQMAFLCSLCKDRTENTFPTVPPLLLADSLPSDGSGTVACLHSRCLAIFSLRYYSCQTSCHNTKPIPLNLQFLLRRCICERFRYALPSFYHIM
jgi:hypothetical protein